MVCTVTKCGEIKFLSQNSQKMGRKSSIFVPFSDENRLSWTHFYKFRPKTSFIRLSKCLRKMFLWLMSDVANGARFGARFISVLVITKYIVTKTERKLTPKRAPFATFDISLGEQLLPATWGTISTPKIEPADPYLRFLPLKCPFSLSETSIFCSISSAKNQHPEPIFLRVSA